MFVRSYDKVMGWLMFAISMISMFSGHYGNKDPKLDKEMSLLSMALQLIYTSWPLMPSVLTS